MKKTTKVLGNAASVGATGGLGLMSFTGTLVFFPALMPLAATMFFLAVTVEGAVYRDNIFQAIDTMINPTLAIELAIAKTQLQKLKEHQDNLFICDYFNQLNYLHELEERYKRLKSEDEEIAQKEIECVQERIKRMQLDFIYTIRHPNETPKDKKDCAVFKALQELTEMPDVIKKEKLEALIISRRRWIHVGVVISLTSGLCAGLATYATLQTTLTTLGIALGLGTAIGIPFIGLAALGYTLLMYRTISDMVKNETLQRWRREIHEFFHTAKRTPIFYVKLLGISILFVLALFATVASAGSWFYLAQAGASFVAGVGPTVIAAVTIAANAISNFLMEFKNSLKSVRELPGQMKRVFKEMRDNIKFAWNNENFLQFINPFRILQKSAKPVMFGGHIFSIAASSDQTPGIPPIVSIIDDGVIEFTTDAHFLMEHTHNEDNHYHHLAELNQDILDISENESLISQKIASDAPVESSILKNHSSTPHDNNHHGHEHHHHDKHEHPEDEHDHKHGDFVLNAIEKFFGYLNAGWDWIFSKNDWTKAKKEAFSQVDLPKAPPLSTAWMERETNITLNEMIKTYQKKGAPEKVSDLHRLKDTLNNRETKAPENNRESFLKTLDTVVTEVIKPEKSLATHRSSFRFFKAEAPRSERRLKHLREDRCFKANPQSIACSGRHTPVGVT